MFWIILGYIVGGYLLVCVAYFLLQERLIFRSAGRGKKEEFKLSCAYEERHIPVASDAQIHGLLLKPEKSNGGLIFYLHGNTGNLKRWSLIAQELLDLGFDIFALDYRGYGQSSGRRTESTMHADIRKVYQYIVAEYAVGKTVIYGRSLGSGFAVRLASREPASGLVLETPFLSLLHVAKGYFPFLPMKWLLRFPLHSDRFIKQVRCPVLMLHGTKDRIVPYSSAFELYKQVQHREDVHLITIPGAGHNNLNAYPSFWEGLREFVAEPK
ncbi:MAG: lysophospholipase [Flavobacteriales bacterium]|nr:lysophospholipase [Flavobacteriales bacterium]